jgi:hypothetical protein
MGGYGSGRRSSCKNTTMAYRRLDVRHWQRDQLLEPGQFFRWHWSRDGEVVALINVRSEWDKVILSYRHRTNGGPWTNEEYPVSIVWTPCTYGGKRAWFLCPGSGCSRRVAILYGGTIFACRYCHKLVYESQRESPSGRALIRAQAIRMILGGTGSMADPFPGKPKNMHWCTYWRLSEAAEAAENRSWPPWIVKRLLASAQDYLDRDKRESEPAGPLMSR